MNGGDQRGGVSTSGSLLLIFFGAFIALGTAYTVAANTTDELTDAYSDELSTQTAVSETALTVQGRYHETDGNLTVRANNDGSTDLAVSETDVLVDGAFRPVPGFEIRTVDGQETDLWQSGEQVRLENESTEPDRVKVVTGTGVAATATVTTVGFENSNPQTLDRTGDGNDSTIAFDVESTYPENVTLRSVTVESVEGEDAETIEYDDETLSELNITRAPDHSEAIATADGPFDVGAVISHEEVTLGPDDTLRYRIGAFRDSDGDPVAMPSTTVTITITFEDPEGVERTFTFEEGGF